MRIYADVLEDEALEQFENAMAQPFVVDGALMPDAHTGYSLPIGAVVATDGYILPAWVGYDIGCGMCALQVPNTFKELIKNYRTEIFEEIYKRIPVGFNINNSKTEYYLEGLSYDGQTIAVKKNYLNALGSLGGGNHFIEIGYDESDKVWIVIHSGSRGVGHGMATHYIKLAHPEGKCKEGHYGFGTDTPTGKEYIQDLNWCLDYALANRKEMMCRVVRAIEFVLKYHLDQDYSGMINRNHNHAVEKDGAWIHRKGATHAETGMLGVIPGNMRDGSFIVEGLGNPDSLYSSSHGAGRVLSRRKAKEVLNLEDFEKEMVNVKALVTTKTLDESPFAYKNIFEVMKLQEDFVKVIAHIKPLINIKG